MGSGDIFGIDWRVSDLVFEDELAPLGQGEIDWNIDIGYCEPLLQFPLEVENFAREPVLAREEQPVLCLDHTELLCSEGIENDVRVWSVADDCRELDAAMRAKNAIRALTGTLPPRPAPDTGPLMRNPFDGDCRFSVVVDKKCDNLSASPAVVPTRKGVWRPAMTGRRKIKRLPRPFAMTNRKMDIMCVDLKRTNCRPRELTRAHQMQVFTTRRCIRRAIAGIAAKPHAPSTSLSRPILTGLDPALVGADASTRFVFSS
jgi:hypothetical protein